jgi:galactose mutarotase-like enzyme
MGFTSDTVGGREVWVGERDQLRIVIVPELGSKIVSLRCFGGREWLYQGSRPLGNNGYASAFDESDGRGWDEMFPNIDPCRVPTAPWKDVLLPDHGEVWSLPWQVESISDNALTLKVHGIRYPYELHKRLVLKEDHVVRFDYHVKNPTPFPMPFFWAAHPLLSVQPLDHVVLPQDCRDYVVSNSTLPNVEPQAVYQWPYIGQSQRLDVVAEERSGEAHKLFFRDKMRVGEAAVASADGRERIEFRFSPEEIPYLAVWVNDGGWRNEHNLALEPAIGFLDVLHSVGGPIANEYILPYGDREWSLEVQLRCPFDGKQ